MELTNLNQLLLNSIPHPIIIIKPDGTIIYCNTKAKEIGCIVNHKCYDVFKSKKTNRCEFCKNDKCCGLSKASSNLTQQRYQPAYALGKIWDLWWIPVSKNLILHYMIDITERKKAEKALLEKEEQLNALEIAKTESILKLTKAVNAGIAHELKTPLQAIKSSLEISIELLEQEPLDKNELKEYIEYALKAKKYASDILNTLSKYAKSGSIGESVCVNIIEELKIIFNTLKMTDPFKSLAENQFRLKIFPENLECHIKINKIEFNQIIHNLCRNAFEALLLDSSKNPIIEINTFVEFNHFIVKIRDNGSGIPIALHDKIFLPFFTTKGETAESRGLGLAIVNNIITYHKGAISFISEPGHTEFTVSFPLCFPSKN